MKKSELKEFIKEEISKILFENEESGLSKRANKSVGLVKIRLVVDGGSLADNKDKVMSIIKGHDPEFKGEFYPATGKIVGTLTKVKLGPIKRDLKIFDNEIIAKEKPQSLKEDQSPEDKIKSILDKEGIDPLFYKIKEYRGTAFPGRKYLIYRSYKELPPYLMKKLEGLIKLNISEPNEPYYDIIKN
jgi:hypothetical protein